MAEFPQGSQSGAPAALGYLEPRAAELSAAPGYPGAPNGLGGPGFIAGLRCIPDAALFIWSNPKTWILTLTPLLVFLGLLAGLSYFFVQYTASWQFAWLSDEASRVGTGFFGIVAAVLLSLLLAPVLSVPAMERLVVEQERALGLPARESIGFWEQWVVSFSSQTLALLVVVPLALGLTLGSLLISPLLLPLTSPIGGALLTWSLLDFPMTLHGMPWRERLALLQRHPRCAFGFALGCGLVNLLPLSLVFILPLGAVGATRCLSKLQGTLGPRGRSTIR